MCPAHELYPFMHKRNSEVVPQGGGGEAYVAPPTQLQAALAVDISHLMQSCTQPALLLR